MPHTATSWPATAAPVRAGGGRPIIVFAHLDVVPARRADWSVDPFTFLEKDGYFYGRGTTDDKVGDAILVADFIRLKRAGYRPTRDLDRKSTRLNSSH